MLIKKLDIEWLIGHYVLGRYQHVCNQVPTCLQFLQQLAEDVAGNIL